MGLADRLKSLEGQQPATAVAPAVAPAPTYLSPTAPPMPAQMPMQVAHVPTQVPQVTPASVYPATHVAPVARADSSYPQQTNQPGPYYNAVKSRIDKVIVDKGLQHFYPPNSPQYNNLLIRLSHVDFIALATKRRLPVEMAFDLAALALVDTVVFADDSGSMNFDENWNQSTEKIEDMKLIFSRIVETAVLFDDDGISIRFFNNNKVFDNVTSEQAASQAIDNISFNGATPIGKHLVTKVFQPYVYSKVNANQFTKPVMVYIITDGAPDDKAELKYNIQQCKQWLQTTPYGKSAVNIMFAQVGRDKNASKFLRELDNDRDIGEDVDTTGNFEMEYEKYIAKGVDLTPDLWLLQMCLGAIDRNYDEGND